MWKAIVIGLYFSGWFALGRWGRKNDKPNVETLAWLMGGISFLMLIFGLLNWELVFLGYK
ncbi:hypothetical protein N9934_02580 [Desulfosarcina sp.]|nr:hypothetical protein [Desulfosarcina sp.]